MRFALGALRVAVVLALHSAIRNLHSAIETANFFREDA
jgi:hypothetical protein